MCVVCASVSGEGIDTGMWHVAGGDGPGAGGAIAGNPTIVPAVVEGSDAAAGTGTAYSINVGQSFHGSLTNGDADWVRVDLVAGQEYTIAMSRLGALGDGLNDSFVRLLDGNGNEIGSNNSDGPGGNSSLTFTAATSGSYYISAEAFGGTGAGDYGLSITEGARATYDAEMGAGALTRTNTSWSGAPETGTTVTWGIRETEGTGSPHYGKPTFRQLTTAQIAATEEAMNMVAQVSGLDFQRVDPNGYTDEASILFAGYNDANYGGYAYYPGYYGSPAARAFDNYSGDVWLNTRYSFDDTNDLSPGSFGFSLLLHEIGHAVGLSHPGDYNAAPGVSITYENSAQFSQDSNQYTVMSYFSEHETTGQYIPGAEDTLLLYDVLAMQKLYGVDTTTRTGNTVYGFNSNAGAVYDFAINDDPHLTIWDAGGLDTLDASGFSGDQVIDLREGHFSDILGYIGNVSIAYNAVIERATGGSGNDTVNGNDANNLLKGLDGNDTLRGGAGTDILIGGRGGDVLDGGSGFDRVSYVSAAARVTADLVASSANTGDAAGDTYLGIEGIFGSHHDDSLRGDGARNYLYGLSGNDFLYGRAGNDVLYGYGGDDSLIGGTGGDLLDGGAGVDRAGYWQASGGVVADLQNAAINTGEAAGDRYVSIEGLFGSNFNDSLRGNAGENRLFGVDGNDTLYGRAGNDDLYGGDDDDILVGGTGGDRLFGGEGFDRASYFDAANGLLVDLANAAAGTGDAAGDTFSGIEGLDGSNFNDSLRGNEGANRLWGRSGDDTLYGRGGNDTLIGSAGDDILVGGTGADVLSGGSGLDRASYFDASAGLIVDLQVASSNTGDAAGDTFSGVEGIDGSNFADSLRGDGGANRLWGRSGNDSLYGRDGNDTLIGSAGDDLLVGGTGADSLDGGSGFDRASYFNASSGLTADLQYAARNTGDAAGDSYSSVEGIFGSSHSDRIFGDSGNNRLYGNLGDDFLYGRDGADYIYGQNGNDNIVAGGGRDTIYTGLGRDIVRFGSALESTTTQTDRVMDFTRGLDKIHLSAVDANGGAAGNGLFWVGGAGFSGTAGEVRFSGGTVQVDTTGNGLANMEIDLIGITSLSQSDFIGVA